MSAKGKFLTTEGVNRAGLQEDSLEGLGRRPPGQPWQQSGEAPRLREWGGCRWDAEAEEGEGTCQSLHSKIVTDLDVLSPSLLHHSGL